MSRFGPPIGATIPPSTGYGHLVPITPLGKILAQLFALIGVPLLLVLVADWGRVFSESILWAYRGSKRLWKGRRKGERTEEEEREEDNQFLDTENEFEFRLPTVPALLLFLSFCAVMSIVYGHLEQWHWLDCFWFSFVSFYSIGTPPPTTLDP